MGMTIHPRGRGFEVYLNVQGQRVRKTLSTYEEAAEYGHRAMSLLLSGKPLPAPQEVIKQRPKTLADAVDYTIQDRWENSCKSAKGLKNQIANAHQLMDLLGPDTVLSAITTEDMEGIKRSLETLSYKTVNRKLTTLSTILRTAFRQGWLDVMPLIPKYPEDPRTDRRLRYATVEEVQEMTRLMRRRGCPSLADFVEVLNGTGMRTGELLGLDDRKIVGNKIELEVFKGGNERTLPMTARVREILEERLSRMTGLVFSDVSQTHLNRIWNECKVEMGLEDDAEFVPNAVRHGVATRLAQHNIHKSRISTWMGHRNEATTEIYIKVAGRDLEGIEGALE
jgi:integrase